MEYSLLNCRENQAEHDAVQADAEALRPRRSSHLGDSGSLGSSLGGAASLGASSLGGPPLRRSSLGGGTAGGSN